MTKTTLISEMQKFSFGNKIVCSDGDDGVLMSVIFDASARRITHIGVKQGRLFGKTVYVPYESVTTATGEGVTLNIKRADVSAAPATPPQGALLDHKSIVENTASAARGTLLLIAIHPESGRLAYLVAHHLRPGQDTLLREEFVTALAPDTVRVNIPAAILDALPPYRPDSVLHQEVEAILYDITPMHVDLPGMTIRVLDGVLYLDGNISSSLRGDIALDQVSGVTGLLEIKSNLIGDDRLANDLPIGVYPRLGTVRLSGAVHNGQQKTAAEEIVRSFPGVRGVINDLVVNPKTDLLYVMARPEGGEAEDIVPGKYIRHTK